MSKAPHSDNRKQPALTVSKVYEPDTERTTRGLLRLAGLSPAEIERVLRRLRANGEVTDATDAPAS